MLEKLKESFKFIGVLVLLAVLGVIIAVVGQLWFSPGWQQIEDVEGNYKIKFPAVPERQTHFCLESPLQGSKVTTLIATVQDGIASYQLDEIDIDEKVNLSGEDLDQFLKSTALSINGTLQPKSTTEQFAINLNSEVTVAGQIILLKKQHKLYRLLVSKPSQMIDTPDVKLFFKCFDYGKDDNQDIGNGL